MSEDEAITMAGAVARLRRERSYSIDRIADWVETLATPERVAEVEAERDRWKAAALGRPEGLTRGEAEGAVVDAITRRAP